MSLESNSHAPINQTPPREVSLSELLDEMLPQITGKTNDPDGYLTREAPPTLDQQVHRALAVAANQPDTLS